MKHLIHCPVYSQYDESVLPHYRSSACGPTAIASILHFYGQQHVSINALYQKLHCTKIGLPAIFITHFLPKIVGDRWIVQSLQLFEALDFIKQNRPVAVKFDRYFNRRFWVSSYFAYHWTVMIGFHWKADELYLLIEDLGTKKRSSKTHEIAYTQNAHALSFIGIHPK